MKSLIVVFALVEMLLSYEAEAAPKATVTFKNELPGELQLEVGHWPKDADITIKPHGSGILRLESDETHMVRRTLFVRGANGGRTEIKDKYPLRVPAGVTEMTVVFGGFQIGAIHNQSGELIWVLPPTLQSLGFAVDGNLDQKLSELRQKLDNQISEALDMAYLDSIGFNQTLFSAIIEGGTSSMSLVDSMAVGWARAGVPFSDSALVTAKWYAAKKMAASRSDTVDTAKALKPASGIILKDRLYSEGVPLQPGEAYIFAVVPPQPKFVIFFGAERELYRELPVNINDVRDDAEFGEAHLDWVKGIVPHHKTEAVWRRR